MELCELTVTEAKRGLAKKEFSSIELTNSVLSRIKKVEKKIHSFITVTEDRARLDAKRADDLLSKGEKGKLLGIPVSFKDIYCTKGIRTTAGSNILANYIPIYNSTAVEKLEKEGVVLVGKTNCDAFAHGSSGENSDFGPTYNPWNLEYVPGGSSSGSATSVVAGEALFATGTDTGGSIRLPASFCNLVGWKPTYGRVSRYGVIAMASSLDSIGCITKTVSDAALVAEVMAGQDANDATTPDVKVPPYTNFLGESIKGIKIGIPKEYFIKGLDTQMGKRVNEAIEIFRKLGAQIKEVSLPHTDDALAVYYIIVPSEISSNLARYDGIRYGYSAKDTKDVIDTYFKSRGEGFGNEAKRRIMFGTYALSAGYYDAYYLKAQKVRTKVKEDFEKAFEDVDLLLAPVSPTPPFKIGEKTSDPLEMYLSDVLAVPINLAGVPSLALPCGFVNDLPVGIQIIGPHFSEERLFKAGFAYEQETKWYKTKPKTI